MARTLTIFRSYDDSRHAYVYELAVTRSALMDKAVATWDAELLLTQAMVDRLRAELAGEFEIEIKAKEDL